MSNGDLSPKPVHSRTGFDFALNPPGIALRDYFAAHAPEMPGWWVRDYPTTDNSMEIFVAWRWFYADAMLAEREK
jgi:hypothetical protein